MHYTFVPAATSFSGILTLWAQGVKNIHMSYNEEVFHHRIRPASDKFTPPDTIIIMLFSKSDLQQVCSLQEGECLSNALEVICISTSNLTIHINNIIHISSSHICGHLYSFYHYDIDTSFPTGS